MAGYQHLLLETDSLGRQLKQRLIEPLGPDFADGSRLNGMCNIVVLPNAGGYIFSGRADSASGPLRRRVAYLMRVDTALTVQWVYRHPTSTNGNGTRSQEAYKVRQLPDGSVAFMVRDVRGIGTSDIYLVQVDAQTGQHRATYTLSSNTQLVAQPLDWKWIGDGTLLLCGESQALGVSNTQAYFARWDFRRTPLATGRQSATAGAELQVYPNPVPAGQPVQVQIQLPSAQGSVELLVYTLLGQCVRTMAVPAGQREAVRLEGLTPGAYVVRLVAGKGIVRTQSLVVVP